MMSEASFGSPNLRSGSLIPYAALAVLLLAVGLYSIFVSAPATRAFAKEQLARTIADENRAVCEKFGMRAGTSQFLDCAEVLATVRQKQADRDHAAEQGF
jgi:hypothetical protein